MARNAHPELTQERIIQAATELFTPRRAQKRLEAVNLMFRKFNPKANPKMIGMEFIALGMSGTTLSTYSTMAIRTVHCMWTMSNKPRRSSAC